MRECFKIPLTASLRLATKFVSLFFSTITEEIQILPAYVRSLTVRDHDCYLKRLTLTDETRLAKPYTLTQSLDDLKGFLTSNLYSKDKFTVSI